MENPRATRMFTARLKDWDPDVVLDTAKAVRDLMAQPGWLRLQELTGQVADRHMRQLTLGPTLEQAEYTRLIGVIAGLNALGEASEAVFEAAREIEVKRAAGQTARAERTG